MTGSDFEHFTAAIARIYNASGVVGAGVLIADHYVLTCAHVVAAALSVPGKSVDSTSDSKPEGRLELDFPHASRGETAQRLRAEVVVWFPEGRPSGGEDIAVLKLLDAAPASIQPMQIQMNPSFQDHHPLKIYGFPGDDRNGRWATVVSMGSVANGWIQVDSQTEGYAIEPGFSGAPVWDSVVNGVVGITVARDRLGSLDSRSRERSPVRVAFMMSKKALLPAFGTLALENLTAILEPYSEQLQPVIPWAYQACRADGWTGQPSSQSLQSLLEDLSKMPPGTTGLSAMGRFAAYLSLHPNVPTMVHQPLQSWLAASGDALESLKAWAQQQVDEWQQRQSVGVQSCMMVRVKPDPEKLQRYYVEAWLIPDVEFYRALTGEGSEQLFLPSQAEDSILLEQMPDLLRHFLDQASRYALTDLTLDIFLPQDCLNHAVEHWTPHDEEGFFVPLGNEYPVMVRSNERLTNYSRKGEWKAKWDTIRHQLQGVARPGFGELLADLSLNQMVSHLGKPDVIGLKMPTPPRTGKGSELALILRTGIPIALWVRQNLKTVDCPTELDQLLGCCIHELPRQIQRKRQEAFMQQEPVQNTEDDPLGHHLSLLWEDFDRVPPPITNTLRQPLLQP